MNVAIVGAGYVGLATGACLADTGHRVTVIDIDRRKIDQLNRGIPPIYEPGLEELLHRHLGRRLFFTTGTGEGVRGAEVVFLAVGTPPLPDGRADLSHLEAAARDVARHLEPEAVVAVKSTVPVGTNDRLADLIGRHVRPGVTFHMASNPEFLREGTAIRDVFRPDRIVIGTRSSRAADVLTRLHAPFGAPVVLTDPKSAELIKYASNAFLTVKISFINEIANLCDKLGANIDDVAHGMGLDPRIGPHFLRAGIGYGGSCFPKDTRALVQLAGHVEHDFRLLKAVIEVNNRQQQVLVHKAKAYFGSLRGLRAAVLGLAFKPGTDDVREAASLVVVRQLLAEGAEVAVYDPVAMPNARRLLDGAVRYGASLADAVAGADAVFIVTEWAEFVDADWAALKERLSRPVIFDGRNCLDPQQLGALGYDYVAVGRPAIVRKGAEA